MQTPPGKATSVSESYKKSEELVYVLMKNLNLKSNKSEKQTLLSTQNLRE